MRKILPLLFIACATLTANADSVYTSVPMTEKGTATYFVKATVGNHDIDLLVDTGAGYATLNRDVITQLRMNGQAHLIGEIEGILANGDILILPVYRVSRFKIGGCELDNIEVAETPPNARNLLGLSVLKRAAPFTFSLDPAELVLSNCSGVYAANSKPGRTPQAVHISATESLKRR